jgi:hypothetical protein
MEYVLKTNQVDQNMKNKPYSVGSKYS